MTILAIIMFSVLFITAALHAYWALGGLWPGRDETSLAKTVIGATGIDKMPPRVVSFVVALAIFAAAIWPLMWRSIIPYPFPQGLVWLGMLVLTVIFLGRGIAGYLPIFRNSFSQQPFARLDRRYFSPLCLALGVGYAVLLINV